MNDADVRMGEGLGCLRFDDESFLEFERVHQVRRQELQSNQALELEIFGFIDNPHPAPADLLDDPVFTGNEAVLGYDVQRGSQGFL